METYNVVLTNKADLDFADIFAYVAVTLTTPKAASDLVLKLHNSMQALSTSPFRCPLAKDNYLAAQGFRTLIIGNYVVFYVVDKSIRQVIIHRILYAKRNYLRLFKNEDLDQ